MSKDYETKRSDLHATRDEPGGERPAAEDPLVELARIVHKNKQSGVNVGSGRVGSTDYFAGLEEVSVKPEAQSAATQSRLEPSFSPAPDQGHVPFDAAAEFGGPDEQIFAEVAAQPVASDRPHAVEAPLAPATGGSSHASALWPDLGDPVTADAAGQTAWSGESTPPVSMVAGSSGALEADTASSQSSLAPSLSIDLEQNLASELEDELIGVLRQSVDDTQPAADFGRDAAGADIARPEEPTVGHRTGFETTAYSPENYLPEAPAATPSAPASFAADSYRVSSSRGTEHYAPVVHQEPRLETPVQPTDETQVEVPAQAPRPRIDENDFFAALNPAQEASAQAPDQSQAGNGGDPAGIDALFADLDFPSPSDRNAGSTDVSQPQPAGTVDTLEIDDMTWPAAAASVPQIETDETPPPPEGYDLDAVARAMQESDPSLTGAGVLPPHSPAESGAVPHAAEKSRRGMAVAAGVVGVAALGAVGFFMLDGDSVTVPSGPPPVISGLQEPLKVFPEDTPASANDQAAKLDYSRVDGTGVSGPDRLVLPDTPQPADLPPAPVGTNGRAELAPGTPKRVRTVIVRPDGSFVSEDEPAAPAASAPPVSAPSGEVPAISVVTTVPDTIPAAAPSSQPDLALPVPATAQTPAGADGTNGQATDPATIETAAPVPSALPRKKPAVPVQVAQVPSAPAAVSPPVAQPAPASGNTGPLNLSQQPAAAAQPAGQTGTIPSGTYIVQVTSQRSAAAATDAYASLQRRYPAILGNRSAVVVAANVEDRGVFYRARIPATSRDEAVSVCESLQAAGGDCFVRRQP